MILNRAISGKTIRDYFVIAVILLQVATIQVGESFTPSICHSIRPQRDVSYGRGAAVEWRLSAPVTKLKESAVESDNNNNDDNDNNNVVSTTFQQQEQPEGERRVAAPKKLDPLLASLTRMDEETQNAPTIQIPVWGELILDRSLFVFLPVAAFAIIGFFTSLYVLINSGDDFDTAIDENAVLQSIPNTFTPPLSVPSDEVVTGCRGLCSSQESDLEGLRSFMNSLAGK
jgi:hypothetical protein